METHHAAEMAAKDARIAELEKWKEEELAKIKEANEVARKAIDDELVARYQAEVECFAASLNYPKEELTRRHKKEKKELAAKHKKEKTDLTAKYEKEKEELSVRYQKEKDAALKAKEDELTSMREYSATLCRQINVMLEM
jgi:hypothetical protein